MSFGVNIFEFLEDENDPDKSTKKLAPKEKLTSSDKPAAAQNKNAKPAKAQTENKKAEQPQPQQQATGGARKSEKHQGGPQASPGERRPRPEKDSKPTEKPIGEDSERPRNRTKGPRGDKTGEKPRGVPPTFEGRQKRQFDRRSGTGRGKETKKGGSGKGNWGSWEEGAAPTEGRKEETVTEQPPTETEGEATAADASESKDTVETKEQKTEEKEPEIVERSLDDYLNEMKHKEPQLPLPQQRQSGEGVDESQWKEFIPLKRDDEEEVLPSKPKKNAKSEPKKIVPASDVLTFSEPRRPRRDDRDRKKGFGGNNKNNTSNKRGSNNKSAPNFSADSFPSLTPATKA